MLMMLAIDADQVVNVGPRGQIDGIGGIQL